MQHFSASFAARGWDEQGGHFYYRRTAPGTILGYRFSEDRYDGGASLLREDGPSLVTIGTIAIATHDPTLPLVIEVIGDQHRVIQNGVVILTVTDATYGTIGTYGVSGMPEPTMTAITSIAATGAGYTGNYHVGTAVERPMLFDLRLHDPASGDGWSGSYGGGDAVVAVPSSAATGDGWSGSYATGDAEVDGSLEFDLLLAEILDVAATGDGWSGSYGGGDAVVAVPSSAATGDGWSGSYAEGDAYDGWDLIIDSPTLTSPFVDTTVVSGTTYQYRALIYGEWVYSEEVLFVVGRATGDGFTGSYGHGDARVVIPGTIDVILEGRVQVAATGDGFTGSYATGEAFVVTPDGFEFIDVILEERVQIAATGDGFTGSYGHGDATVVTPGTYDYIDVVLEAEAIVEHAYIDVVLEGEQSYDYIDVVLEGEQSYDYIDVVLEGHDPDDYVIFFNKMYIDRFLYNGVESEEWIFNQ